MTPEDLQKKITELQLSINTDLIDGMTALGLNSKAAIQSRIQEQGVNDKGAVFDPYSDAYLKRKTNAGRYRGFVDFTLSGDMWKGTTVIDSKVEGTKTIVTVGGNSQETKNKLTWNSESRGNLLNLSDKEQQNILEDLEVLGLEIINKYMK